ncbi:MAG TPA: hypothetical protein VFS04_03755 [Alphaproteobacteria bacterium]|nr:hypothetical protein [Alphaproteobacteria bacterium]
MTSVLAKKSLAKIGLLGVAAAGLAGCVAEPAGYYPARTTYYSSPGYYYYAPPPRPVYQSYSFTYRDDDDDRRGPRGRGRGHHRGW